jgi:hypothetical protein
MDGGPYRTYRTESVGYFTARSVLTVSTVRYCTVPSNEAFDLAWWMQWRWWTRMHLQRPSLCPKLIRQVQCHVGGKTVDAAARAIMLLTAIPRYLTLIDTLIP